MKYSTFSQLNNDPLKEPMFFGNPVNLSRFDQQKHEVFEKLTEKQLSFFWRPEEIDISKDRIDFNELTESEQHIFLSNLKFQIILDSIQGRSPNMVLLPLVSIPELETWIELWSAFEGAIHSRSYTHIIRGIVNSPETVFNDIMINEDILKRAKEITKYYDELLEYVTLYNLVGFGRHTLNGKDYDINPTDMKKKLYLCLVSINVLEGILFYVSFSCSFAYGERKLMEGNASIIRLIARDEQIHLQGTQYLINLFKSGKDDLETKSICEECETEAISIFRKAAEQEMAWADYLFKDGSMIGLNADILKEYVKYITNIRMNAVGFEGLFPEVKGNPIPWVNNWLSSDNVQVAPQETEITSYLVGQVTSDLEETSFDEFSL